MSRLPAALFVVDIKAEHIAIKEALKHSSFAMVDTNSDPREVEFVIPSNDDASKSIDKILSLVTAAIVEGLSDRGSDKETDATEKAAPAAEK
jgi:small subunit ribosomal protein S2